jgi:hypothetical protein
VEIAKVTEATLEALVTLLSVVTPSVGPRDLLVLLITNVGLLLVMVPDSGLVVFSVFVVGITEGLVGVGISSVGLSEVRIAVVALTVGLDGWPDGSKGGADMADVEPEGTSLPVDVGDGDGACVRSEEVCTDMVEVGANGRVGDGWSPTVSEVLIVDPVVGLLAVVGLPSEVRSVVGVTIPVAVVFVDVIPSSKVAEVLVASVGLVADCWLVPVVNSDVEMRPVDSVTTELGLEVVRVEPIDEELPNEVANDGMIAPVVDEELLSGRVNEELTNRIVDDKSPNEVVNEELLVDVFDKLSDGVINEKLINEVVKEELLDEMVDEGLLG